MRVEVRHDSTSISISWWPYADEMLLSWNIVKRLDWESSDVVLPARIIPVHSSAYTAKEAYDQAEDLRTAAHIALVLDVHVGDRDAFDRVVVAYASEQIVPACVAPSSSGHLEISIPPQEP